MQGTTAQLPKRRDKGEGSIWFNEDKNRWYAQLSLGCDEYGKKIRKTVSASNKSEVILKMRDIIRGDNTLIDMRNQHQIVPKSKGYQLRWNHIPPFPTHVCHAVDRKRYKSKVRTGTFRAPRRANNFIDLYERID